MVFATHRHLCRCNDVTQAELHVMIEGLAPCQLYIVHTDCSVALNALMGSSLDQFAYGHLISEIRRLLELSEFVLTKTSRDQNRVVDCLANFCRPGSSTACWMSQNPPCIDRLLLADRNPII